MVESGQFLGHLLLSCILAGAGLYVLTHPTKLARGLQNIYIRACEQKQKSGSWAAGLYIYDPDYWRRPFAWFMFKFGMIFIGIWLLLVATVPIGPYFSPIHLFGQTIYVGAPYGWQ